MSSDSKRWLKRNASYFSISEEGISLSKSGKRILSNILTEATKKNPEIWVPGGFDKEMSKYPNNKITKELVTKIADKFDVDIENAISYVEYGWDLELN